MERPDIPIYMDNLLVGDLFSGIGGFSYGLHETEGFTTSFFCEKDPWCQRLLYRRFQRPVYDNITELTKAKLVEDEVPLPDVLTGGFPCQDISTAQGTGAKGILGSRSGLWAEFARLIEEIQPRYAIIENVSALRSRGLALVLQNLSSLGYDAEWHCVPAGAIGARHRRDRVWIIAYPNSARVQQPRTDQKAGGELRDTGSAGDVREEEENFTKVLPYAGSGRCYQDEIESCDDEAGGCALGGVKAFLPCRPPVSREPTGKGGADGEEKDVADCSSLVSQRAEPVGDTGQRSEVQTRMLCHRPILRSDVLVRLGQKYCSEVWSPSTESGVLRVAHGIPERVHRVRSLGNSIVPQLAEWIGECILIREHELRTTVEEDVGLAMASYWGNGI